MQTVWFFIVSLMIATYVVLDGFDFGAGILHLIVAKTDTERRSVFAAIGPLWDGNEVWLLAGGGLLFFSFPRAYSAGFSGFYLPLMMVLWLLILRGISIEFRSLEQSPLWRSFWDGVFFLSSALMAIVLGAALGNVVRGVPLEANGFFSGPLFTNFMPGTHPGVLDWYTVLVGVFALCVLALHGSLFLRIKLEGDVHVRAAAVAKFLWIAVLVLGILVTIATRVVNPTLFDSLISGHYGIVVGVLAFIAFLIIPALFRHPLEGAPFLASCAFIALLLAATALGVYPNLLISTINPAYTLNIDNASPGGIGLQVGIYWWVIAIAIAIGYFIYLFRTFRGKVQVDSDYAH